MVVVVLGVTEEIDLVKYYMEAYDEGTFDEKNFFDIYLGLKEK